MFFIWPFFGEDPRHVLSEQLEATCIKFLQVLPGFAMQFVFWKVKDPVSLGVFWD